ncbi:MAG: cell division ATP-binding protein FtsE [Ruminococcaceae bacterium]|nr:cell division ATP-binding protein FtsE [Oscillospiraceae bacterium]
MIEFQNVYKTYGTGTDALHDVNLHIDDGEFAFIVGASGAGKSTFLKLIMREETPSSGEVIVNNYRLSRLKRKQVPYFRRTMGIVFQDFRLIDTMTVYNNVAFSMRVVGKSRREIRRRIPHVLKLFGLWEKAHRYPPELSGGEQQRVGLARALVNNPSLIIADEPTGNVDPQMSHDIVQLLTQINEKGTTVLMVTHQHDLVKQFEHRVITLEDGRIVSDTGRKDGADPEQNMVRLGGGEL